MAGNGADQTEKGDLKGGYAPSPCMERYSKDNELLPEQEGWLIGIEDKTIRGGGNADASTPQKFKAPGHVRPGEG